jgi:hypothetical protein
LAAIFDGLALVMIDGEVRLGRKLAGLSGFRFPSKRETGADDRLYFATAHR